LESRFIHSVKEPTEITAYWPAWQLSPPA
jgi:hypothetical protein